MIKGRIYKIIGNNLTYYGSTTESLNRRLSRHRSRATNKNEKCRKYTSCKVISDPNHQIILIEEIEDETKDELKERLRLRERFFIQNNECVNKSSKLNLVNTPKVNDDRKTYMRLYMRTYRKKRPPLLITETTE